MFPNVKLFLCSALLAVAAVNAEPIPEDKRQIGSVFNSITSEVGSDFSVATSFLGSVGNGVYGTVTSFGGSLYTVLSSDGGSAITLAGSVGGVATSWGGHEYTILTSGANSLATGPTGTTQQGAAVSRNSIRLSEVLLGLGGAAVGFGIVFA